MAHGLHLKVIAEGVENEAQMSFLRYHRCDEIQGYYFSKPVSAGDAATLLQCEQGFGGIGEATAVVKSFWPASEGYSGLPQER
jgi:predicted signal transduction protein with EAL and GGDEF domain